MKLIALSLAGLVVLGASAQAQTIIGESTYGDNYLHTPPPVAAPARPVADRPKAEVPPAPSRPAPADERR